ncbi:MAG: VWA domain-containing protein [Deltaproteobacteria bacterium]|nr:VWA domain-containing protein [Deltaproteobacteria bacterium]
MHRLLRHGLGLGVLLGATACHDTAIVVGGLQEVASLKAIPNRDLDILFVIDDSPSMTDKQASLAANFPRMMDALAQLDGGLPNLHIGVVTSDMGTNGGPAIGAGQGACTGVGKDGALQASSAFTGTWISDVDDGAGGRTRNYDPAVAELPAVFTQLALVGDAGCGFEQPLAAMRRALINPANAGFVRPEANLAIVILTDEDDCSALGSTLFGPDSEALGPLQSFRCFEHGVVCDPDAPREVGIKQGCVPRADSLFVEDVQPFVDAVLATKGDPRKVLVGAIVGDPGVVAVELRTPSGTPQISLAHSCTFEGPSGPQVADPAVRLAAFLDAFTGRSTLTTICSADLSAPLGTIGQSAKALVGDPCIDTAQLTDSLPELPGVQPACEVTDVRDSAPDAPRVIPQCASGGTDCFQFVVDPVACPLSVDHVRLKIDRAQVVADDAWTYVRCQVAE